MTANVEAAIQPVPQPNKAVMLDALAKLFDPADVIELRAIHKSSGKRRRIDSGYFDHAHWGDLAEHAERLNRCGAAVYVTLNPVDPHLLSRYCNRIEERAAQTTGDKNIVRRRWLLVDLDPQRPTDTGATEDQVLKAHHLAKAIVNKLKSLGWPTPFVAESGNGVHLLYGLDLPNDDESDLLLKSVLAGLGEQFDADGIKVDRVVWNAARICKLYGTTATKGDHTAATPWRLSELVHSPPQLAAVPVDKLREVAALAPAALARRTTPNATYRSWPGGSHGAFNLEAFLARHNIECSAVAVASDDGREKFELARCPFNPEHADGDAAIFRWPNGKLGFKCFHDSCSENRWREARALLEGPQTGSGGPVRDEIDIAASMAAAALRRASGGAAVSLADAVDGLSDGAVRTAHVVDIHGGDAIGSRQDCTPFAPHLLTPPGMAGEIARWVCDTSHKPQPALAVSAALTMMGGALANRVRLGTSYTNLYFVNVANSGEGKDRPQACVSEALTAAGPQTSAKVPGSHLASGQALMTVAHREPTTVLVLDELGDMLGKAIARSAASFEREVLTILKTLWSHTGRPMKGKEFADQKARPRQDIQYPCVSMLGSSTPGRFYAAITPDEIEDGLLNRMLIVRAPNYEGAPLWRAPASVPPAVAQWLGSACAIKPAPMPSLEQTHGPREVRCSPPAELILGAFAESAERERRALLADPARASLAGWWVRAAENANRIALILAVGRHTDPDALHALAEGGDLDIDPASAQWAVDYVRTIVCDMLEQSESRIGSSELERVVLGVEAALRKAGAPGLTQREARRNCNAFDRVFDPVLAGRVWESLKLRGASAATYAPASGRGRAREVLIGKEFAESTEDARHAA